MPRPLYQRLDNSQEFTLREAVRRIMAPVWELKNSTFYTPYYFNRDTAPQWVKDNVPKGTKIPDWLSPMWQYYGAQFEDGVGFRIGLNYLLQYIKLPDIEDDFPPDGLDIGSKIIQPFMYRNYAHSLKYYFADPDYFEEQLAVRTAMHCLPGKYTLLRLTSAWETIGVQLWKIHPNNPAVVAAEKYLDALEDFINDQVRMQQVLNIVQTLLMVKFLGAGLSKIPGLEGAGEKIDTVFDSLISVDKILETGADVVSDTIEDKLDQVRRDIVSDIRDVDNNTAWNLDSVIDLVNTSGKNLINGIDNTLDTVMSTLVKDITDRLNKAENDVNDLNPDVKKVNDESRVTGALGVALGFKRLFFRGR